ncbi:hypothetical protein D9V37_06625 [Nocardioides mangrovicus]|uniref:Uncharacterized protein n=1 Tax=Nocardioides mangrovicus TaxID=2478913 RepID=A0A3L8P3D0_9ACTN|nr:hypothetical protein [Nocardioides mangrovicus]RLV49594.1 hypothetical protein D9V37_06625 [Nocardioides mangrovicus]
MDRRSEAQRHLEAMSAPEPAPVAPRVRRRHGGGLLRRLALGARRFYRVWLQSDRSTESVQARWGRLSELRADDDYRRLETFTRQDP